MLNNRGRRGGGCKRINMTQGGIKRHKKEHTEGNEGTENKLTR